MIFWLCGMTSQTKDGQPVSTWELVNRMKDDPAELKRQRYVWEHVFRLFAPDHAQRIVRYLVNVAKYLSDVVGDQVPVLVPRDVVEAGAGIARPPDADALLVGKAMQRAIRTELNGKTDGMTQAILAGVQELIAGYAADAVPANGRYLNTAQIAKRLSMAPKTVRKLCNQGQIKAKKLAGGEWRATQEDLDDSPYLKKKNRRGNASVE